MHAATLDPVPPRPERLLPGPLLGCSGRSSAVLQVAPPSTEAGCKDQAVKIFLPPLLVLFPLTRR